MTMKPVNESQTTKSVFESVPLTIVVARENALQGTKVAMMASARLVKAAVLIGTDVRVDSFLIPKVVARRNQAKEARARVTRNVRVNRTVSAVLARHVPLASLLHQGLGIRALTSGMSLRGMVAAHLVCHIVFGVQNGTTIRRYARFACLALGWLHLPMMIHMECTARPVLVDILYHQMDLTGVARQDFRRTRRMLSQGIVAPHARPLAILLGCLHCAT